VRILVTGGAGFIGSHLTLTLAALGHDVTVVDLVERDLAPARMARADVTDVSAICGIAALARPEVVYHLAAQIDARRSVEDPASDAQVNVAGTAAVLEAARRAGARRVVLASSAAVYGDAFPLPTPETAALAPRSPYGAGKAAAELYLRMFSLAHGVSTLALRLANVYGPRGAGIVATLGGGGAVTIFGDGHQTRDYVFVSDVVDAFIAAGVSDVEGELNVGTGRETSVLELITRLGLAALHAEARPGECRRSCLASARAALALGWRARTPLEVGLAATLGAPSTLPACA
jgi:UDP-glucose 4-epimerase